MNDIVPHQSVSWLLTGGILSFRWHCPVARSREERSSPSASGRDQVGRHTPSCAGSSGGCGGIRTHGTLARPPVFKTGAINHSTTHPNMAARVGFEPTSLEPKSSRHTTSVPGNRAAPVRQTLHRQARTPHGHRTGRPDPPRLIAHGYWRIGRDSNPRDRLGSSRFPSECHRPLDHLSKLAARGGLEPPTFRFRVGCATYLRHQAKLKNCGGWGGIRTHGTFASPPG